MTQLTDLKNDVFGHPIPWLVHCCFTSTETVGLLGTGAQDGQLDFLTAPELCPSHPLSHSLFRQSSLLTSNVNAYPLVTPTCGLPWYNRNGWLGVKHQVTYSMWDPCHYKSPFRHLYPPSLKSEPEHNTCTVHTPFLQFCFIVVASSGLMLTAGSHKLPRATLDWAQI